MKKILFTATLVFALVFALSSCKKDGKGCWRGYDGLLVQTGVFCDKTKEEARAMPYTAFVCPADEQKYCWLASNGNHYNCIPQTIIEDWGRPQGLTFTKENCTGTCRYKPFNNAPYNISTRYIAGRASPKNGASTSPHYLQNENLFYKLNLKTLL